MTKSTVCNKDKSEEAQLIYPTKELEDENKTHEDELIDLLLIINKNRSTIIN